VSRPLDYAYGPATADASSDGDNLRIQLGDDVPDFDITLFVCRLRQDGARYWVRTSDPYRVKVVLYH
jgi:hypothetical protein